jgi:hypothetical protein
MLRRYVRLWTMATGPDAPVEIDGILFREYFMGRFSIGGDGPWMMKGTPLTHAILKLGPARFVAEVLTTGIKAAANPLAAGGSWSYHEVEKAQVFKSPLWATRRGLSLDEFPVGVRLHLGESRSAFLFFTTEIEPLLDGLESHSVTVERTPTKLSPFLLGRR